MKKIALIVVMAALFITGCTSTATSTTVIDSTTPDGDVSATETSTTETKYLDVITQDEFDRLYSDDMIGNYAKMFLGKEIPNLEVRDADGSKMDFESLKGKPFVVEFMGTWCPVCAETYPAIEQLADENPELTVLSVVTDEDEQTVATYMEKNEFTKPIKFSNVNGEAFYQMFKLEFVPAFFFVNENGIIERIHIGGIDYETLTNIYETTLK